jgi:MFS family permease
MQLRQTWARASTWLGGGQAAPEGQITQRNLRLLYWDVVWFGLFFGFSGNFLVVFVARLNPSPWLVSAVTSGPALINVIWQLWATRIVERHPDPQRLTVRAALPMRMGTLAIALIPWFLPRDWQAYGIVAVILLQGIPTAIVFVAFQTFFTDIVPRHRMADVVGTRNALMGLTSTIIMMVSGVVLTTMAFPLGYQVLFLAGFFATMASLWTVTQLRLDPSVVPAQPRTVVEAGAAPALWRDGNFLRFSISAGILHLGLIMVAPLFPLYWVDNLGLSDGWISVFVTTLSTTSIIGAFGLRALGQRWRINGILGIAAVLYGLHPILISMLTQPVLIAVVAALSGVWGGVINVMLFNALTEVIPPRHRARYIGVYTWLMNIAIFAAPLVGAALASATNVQLALVVAGLLRVVSGALFLWLPFRSWDQDPEPVAAPAT